VHGLFFPVLGWKMNTPAGFRDVCAVAAFWVNSSDIFAAVAIKYVFVSVCAADINLQRHSKVTSPPIMQTLACQNIIIHNTRAKERQKLPQHIEFLE